MTTKTIPIGLQLFSVRGEVARDLPATLKAVADIGYQGAEPWGYGGEALAWQGHSAQDIRRLYDDHGLTCCGLHLSTRRCKATTWRAPSSSTRFWATAS